MSYGDGIEQLVRWEKIKRAINEVTVELLTYPTAPLRVREQEFEKYKTNGSAVAKEKK